MLAGSAIGYIRHCSTGHENLSVTTRRLLFQ